MKAIKNYYISKEEKSKRLRIALRNKIIINTLCIIIPLISAISYMIYDLIMNEGINI